MCCLGFMVMGLKQQWGGLDQWFACNFGCYFFQTFRVEASNIMQWYEVSYRLFSDPKERDREKFICHISHNQYNNNFTQWQAARKENSITAGHLW